MAPITRKQDISHFKVPENAKKSAVLILLYPGPDGLHFPLILRNAYEGVHSRQISFPGGTWEEADGNLQQTALREAQEEVAVQPENVEVMGALSQLYIPPSNFLVQPYLAVARRRPQFVPDPAEVAEVIEAPLTSFQNGDFLGESVIAHRSGTDLLVPSYTVNGHVVWGATAMMLSELMVILKEAQA